MKECHVLSVRGLWLSGVEMSVHVHAIIGNREDRTLAVRLWIQATGHAQIEPGLSCIIAVGHQVSQWSLCCHYQLLDIALSYAQGGDLAFLSGGVPSG